MPSATQADSNPAPSADFGGLPVFRIDLSRAPQDRYRECARQFKPQLAGFVIAFERWLGKMTPFPKLSALVAQGFLRRVHSAEETAEMRGIAEEADVPWHCLVALNVFSELFVACIGGGVRVDDAGADGNREAIVHFRALEWQTQRLRSLMVGLEYVREGEVVARAVSYVGLTGIVTGVRKGLSITYNHRTRVNSKSLGGGYTLHHLAILMGTRPTMPSRLRNILLSPKPVSSPAVVATQLSQTPTAPCFLTLCSPTSMVVLEKEVTGSVRHVSEDFLVVTNHDVEMEKWSQARLAKSMKKQTGKNRELLEHSFNVKRIITQLYTRKEKAMKVDDVVGWLETKPMVNDWTHHSIIMDPSVDGGGMRWVTAYAKKVDTDSDPKECTWRRVYGDQSN